MTLIALYRVQDRDAGLASSLPNVGQQVGGSIGLALLGTVAWTVVANTARTRPRPRRRPPRPPPRPATRCTRRAAQAQGQAIYDHALAIGFSRGFVVSAGIMLIALIVTIASIRVTREDLAGADRCPRRGAGQR